MIPIEDAQKYVLQNKKPEVDRFAFSAFSEPYRFLANLLRSIE